MNVVVAAAIKNSKDFQRFSKLTKLPMSVIFKSIFRFLCVNAVLIYKTGLVKTKTKNNYIQQNGLANPDVHKKNSNNHSCADIKGNYLIEWR